MHLENLVPLCFGDVTMLAVVLIDYSVKGSSFYEVFILSFIDSFYDFILILYNCTLWNSLPASVKL